MLRYNVRIVYTDGSGTRCISEYDVETWPAIHLALTFFDLSDTWKMIFMTVRDNTSNNRIHGPRQLLTFYDAAAGIEVLKPHLKHEPHEAIVSRMGDFIWSHNVEVLK